MFKKLIFATLVITFAEVSYADVSYDEKENAVIIQTSRDSDGDIGRILIKNREKIYLTAFGKHGNEKIKLLCGIDPSLSIISLDGKMQSGQNELNVSEVMAQHKSLNYTDEDIKAGFVSEYVFKNDVASEMLNLLLAHDTVGFEISGDKCSDTRDVAAGKLFLEFETRGLEKGLARIK